MLFSLDFPLAYGPLNASGDFRRLPEDFQVDEILGYEPSGEGEHVFLHILKRGENTASVAQAIARLAGVQEMDVGYCGRKDRHAVTAQWFSVYLPKEPLGLEWAQLNSDSVQMLSVSRHQHKLRRGEHECNQFVIRLRDMTVDDKPVFERKIEQIFAQGVPNYFGEQRFGRGGNNLHQANLLLIDRKPMRDKQKRGLILSAARSYLFNQVLAARVSDQTWQTQVAGEPEPCPSGPLWGRGRSLASDRSLAIEQQVLASWQEWCNALEHQGLQQERRPLSLVPSATRWRWIDNDLELSFTLGGGEFATALLRELAVLRSAEHPADMLVEPSL